MPVNSLKDAPRLLETDVSGEENFITISNEDGGTSSRHKVHRIAHQNRILLDQSHPDSHRDITQLRSLVALGCDIHGLVLHPSIKLLRVLALERCTSPDIQEYGRHWLEHLGTLVHLRCDEYTKVPDGFHQKVTSLEELQISVRMLSFESKRQFLKELGNHSLLRVLCVIGTVRLDESVQAELLKSLGNLQEPEHLDLDCNLLSGITPTSTEWDKAVLSEHLRHLYIEGFRFPRVSSFIDPTLLPNLCYLELCVDHMDEAGLRALGGLPDLRYLCIRLVDYGTTSYKQAAVVNIAAHDVLFLKLRSLKLYGWMVQLATNDDSTSASLSIWREE
ncbi:uncharacterized protein [Miscanthus floridulus]|uniref:uncharacterized protein n=1 Tax=Miscanthus floridulus TaxID=154761 RepID=UPI00345B041D